MRSPQIGLLLQHGHIADFDLAKKLASTPRRPIHLFDAIRLLTAKPADDRQATTVSAPDNESVACAV
ncbi:MAG: hypothetical protein WA777_05175 [Rhodanobacter sp.]